MTMTDMLRYLLLLLLARIFCRPHRCNEWNDAGTGPMVHVENDHCMLWCPVCLGGFVISTSIVGVIREWRHG